MKDLKNKITFNDRDEYKRSDIANRIIDLIVSDIDTSPMIIDGGWGTGKTEFCFKLINLVREREKNHKVVYIDAFNEDHTDAPILTLLAAIVTLLPKEDRTSLIKKALPALRFGLKTTLKAGASWALKQQIDKLADDFQEAAKKSSNAAIDATIEALLDDHIDSEKNINLLRRSLTEISEKTPIIIFIDELDRCKPTFAISILENIKHVFDVSNVHFVLITNTKQLEASINHIYGHSVDAKRYLDKFVRFTFSLPDYSKINNNNDEFLSSLHWKAAVSQSENLKAIDDPTSGVAISLIELRKLSLREVETLARHIEIYQKIAKKPIHEDTPFIIKALSILGVFIYCFEKELAIKMTTEKFNKIHFFKSINIERINYGASEYPGHLQVLLHALTRECGANEAPTSETSEKWDGYQDTLSNFRRPENGLYNTVINAIDALQMK